MKKGLDFLVAYNFWVAFCAVLMTMISYQKLLLAVNWVLLSLIFVATFFIYNMERSSRQVKYLQFLRGLSVAILFILFFFIKFRSLAFLTHLSFLSLLYAFPTQFGRIALRNIPLLKIFLITYCWASVTVLLPVVEAGNSLFTASVGYYFVERMVFIFAIALPFDIGDYETDKQMGIKTFPILIGIRNTRFLAYTLILIFGLLKFWEEVDVRKLVAVGVVCLGCWILIYYSSPQQPKSFYQKYLDGMMLLYGTLYLTWHIT
jgi:4-hydroxybenzoate polyprenyltransferase